MPMKADDRRLLNITFLIYIYWWIMDFQQLLQQASSNQKRNLKKYEKDHLARVEEQRHQERKQLELKMKAAARLKEAREHQHKEKMRYHGIVDTPLSSGTVSSKESLSSKKSTVSKPHPSKSESHHSHKEHSTKSKLAANSSSRNEGGKLTSSKTSKRSPDGGKGTSSGIKSSKPDKPGKSTKPHKGTKLDKAAKHVSSSTKNPISSSSNDKGKTGKHLSVPNGLSKSSHSRSSSPMPNQRSAAPGKTIPKFIKPSHQTHDFKELIKMAAQNKTSKDSVAVRPADARTKAQPSATPRSSSPLGKSLLERNHLKAKGGSVRSDPTLRAAMASSAMKASVETGKSESKTTKTAAAARQDGRVRRESLSSMPTDLARRPLKKAADTSSSPAPAKKAAMTTSNSGDVDKVKALSRSGGDVRAKNATSAHMRPRPGAHPAVRGGRPLPGKDRRGGAAATAFYGAAAARILGKDGSSKNSRSSGLGAYRSSWVDEMADYVRSNEFDVEDYYSDEEDEDDLDGFVASDDEEEGVDDYSSEISKIFGYDRRKYKDTDDLAMESSYAQQEYEEIRSARIGRAEDEEELAREKLQQERKRKKLGGKPPVLKQSKLGY